MVRHASLVLGRGARRVDKGTEQRLADDEAVEQRLETVDRAPLGDLYRSSSRFFCRRERILVCLALSKGRSGIGFFACQRIGRRFGAFHREHRRPSSTGKQGGRSAKRRGE